MTGLDQISCGITVSITIFSNYKKKPRNPKYYISKYHCHSTFKTGATKPRHKVSANVQIYHLLFDGPLLAQKGQRWKWLHPAWASTSSLHWGEASSLVRVYHTAPSVDGRSYPTTGEECTWKTQIGLFYQRCFGNMSTMSAPTSNTTQCSSKLRYLHWCIWAAKDKNTLARNLHTFTVVLQLSTNCSTLLTDISVYHVVVMCSQVVQGTWIPLTPL